MKSLLCVECVVPLPSYLFFEIALCAVAIPCMLNGLSNGHLQRYSRNLTFLALVLISLKRAQQGVQAPQCGSRARQEGLQPWHGLLFLPRSRSGRHLAEADLIPSSYNWLGFQMGCVVGCFISFRCHTFYRTPVSQCTRVEIRSCFMFERPFGMGLAKALLGTGTMICILFHGCNIRDESSLTEKCGGC